MLVARSARFRPTVAFRDRALVNAVTGKSLGNLIRRETEDQLAGVYTNDGGSSKGIQRVGLEVYKTLG